MFLNRIIKFNINEILKLFKHLKLAEIITRLFVGRGYFSVHCIADNILWFFLFLSLHTILHILIITFFELSSSQVYLPVLLHVLRPRPGPNPTRIPVLRLNPAARRERPEKSQRPQPAARHVRRRSRPTRRLPRRLAQPLRGRRRQHGILRKSCGLLRQEVPKSDIRFSQWRPSLVHTELVFALRDVCGWRCVDASARSGRTGELQPYLDDLWFFRVLGWVPRGRGCGVLR